MSSKKSGLKSHRSKRRTLGHKHIGTDHLRPIKASGRRYRDRRSCVKQNIRRKVD